MSDKEYSYKVQEELNVIINNARATGKEISLGQAFLIRHRSFRLKKEGERYSPINPKTKIKQIEDCWRKRARKLGK